MVLVVEDLQPTDLGINFSGQLSQPRTVLPSQRSSRGYRCLNLQSCRDYCGELARASSEPFAARVALHMPMLYLPGEGVPGIARHIVAEHQYDVAVRDTEPAAIAYAYWRLARAGRRH